MILRTPKYRLHKPSGRAVVTIGGHDIYLGPYQSPESKLAYDREISRWLAAGRPKVNDATEKTVGEIMVEFLRFAQTYYAAASREFQQFIYSLRPLKTLYVDTPSNC